MAVSEVVEGERILELPLAARDATSLITLSGAAVDVGAGAIGGTMTTGTAISVAGGQRMGVLYTLDGAMHNNRWFEGNMPTPFPDALAEFRVSTSAQEAQSGRSSGATVSQITRSGTNVFHGTAFLFGRNAALNARQATARERDPLKRNQPGATLGGPLMRNRLFFFGGYQSTIERSAPSSTLSIVPTAAMLAGDWTAFNRCYRPNWRDPDLAAGRISPARYSPVALAIAAKLPQAENDCGELRWGARSERHDKQIVTRFDYQHNPNMSFFGRYLGTQHWAPLTYDPSNLLTAGTGTQAENNWAHQFSIGQDWVLGPTAVNSLRVAHSRIITDRYGAEFFNPTDVGINAYTTVPNAVPVQRGWPLRVRQRDGVHAGLAEPVSDREPRRRDPRRPPNRLRRRLGARRHPLVLEYVRRRQHERRSRSDRQRDGRLLPRQHDADPAGDAGIVEPGAALRRPLRPGHLANHAAADAELRRPVGAVSAVRLDAQSGRPAGSVSTASP